MERLISTFIIFCLLTIGLIQIKGQQTPEQKLRGQQTSGKSKSKNQVNQSLLQRSKVQPQKNDQTLNTVAENTEKSLGHRFDPYFWKLAYVSGLALVLGVIGWLVKRKFFGDKNKGNEYGKARWLTLLELKKQNILRKLNSSIKPGEIFLGVYLQTQIAVLPVKKAFKHTYIVGITGSGKTLTFLAANIVKASVEESLFINDTKTREGEVEGELWIETSGYRPRAIYFDPMDPSRNMLKFNPIPSIRGNGEEALKLAAVLVENATDASENSHFPLSAKPLLAACMLHAAVTIYPNLVTVYRILMMEPEKMKFVLENSPCQRARLAIRQFLDTGEKEAASVLTTTRNCLQFMMSEKVEQFCWTKSGTDFAHLLRQTNHSIYYQMRDENVTLLKPLNALIFSYLLGQIKKVKGSPVKLLLDEFANMGKIPTLVEEITLLRTKRISVNACVQSYRSQIEKIYGKYGADTLLGNFNNHVILPGLLEPDARLISSQIGMTTVTSTSTSKKTGSLFSENTTISSHAQPLLSAEEIMHMEENQVLVSRSSELHPFRLTRENYTTPTKAAEFRPFKHSVIPKDLSEQLLMGATAYSAKNKKKGFAKKRTHPPIPEWS